ncbi:conserved protein of unknown function (plasmid) [Rhodovastum atsumiense]|uniref:Uncharacterized protein n=1 Tax=Rhodovastum atsumiense TaxID=504468 RepID=A0A5M6IW18_9PROT|nr:hypothetical protein [Rhodovastum atsumiense]KAA5611605.1 hypothetical protein F1189_13665 [Rhodovastum atsumiense]CAH2606310.1 conserved protein of unknown function [Rhodovastum atsumiense]
MQREESPSSDPAPNAPEEPVLIFKHNRGYYRPNECGYTNCTRYAGHYPRPQAEEIAAIEPENFTLYPVPQDPPELEALAESMFLADCEEPDAHKRKIGGVPAEYARWGEGCGTQIGMTACESYRRRARMVLSLLAQQRISIIRGDG